MFYMILNGNELHNVQIEAGNNITFRVSVSSKKVLTEKNKTYPFYSNILHIQHLLEYYYVVKNRIILAQCFIRSPSLFLPFSRAPNKTTRGDFLHFLSLSISKYIMFMQFQKMKQLNITYQTHPYLIIKHNIIAS